MKITISGMPGAGKSTIRKILAKKLKLKQIGIGDYVRELAKKAHEPLIKYVKSDVPKLQDKLKQWQEKLNKKDNFILDSRVGFLFVDGIHIFLKVNPIIGAVRIFHQRRSNEISASYNNALLKQYIKEVKKRISLEKKMYKRMYNINFYDKKYYDLIIDTTTLTIDEVVDKILSFIRRRKKNRY